MTIILVDADACPVKEEIYKVAFRTKIPVVLVSNSYLRTPDHPLVSQEVVEDSFDAADDRIVEKACAADIVITADILLAERVLVCGSIVIAPNGKLFTENSIGSAVATRAIMADLRAGGANVGGPAPFSKSDRSRFLEALDSAITRKLRDKTVS